MSRLSEFIVRAGKFANSSLIRGRFVFTNVGSGSGYIINPTSNLVKPTIPNASDWIVIILN